MMFTAPELVETQLVQMLDQPQVALKLQSRVVADRMMWRQECAETDARHQESSLVRSTQFGAIDGAGIPKAIRPEAAAPSGSAARASVLAPILTRPQHLTWFLSNTKGPSAVPKPLAYSVRA